VDILVNNAGVLAGGPAQEVPLADWQWALGVNFWSAVHSVHSFVPQMIEQGSGQLVNVISIAGLFGGPLIAPYSASKFATFGLSEALAIELAHLGISVTAICPGVVQTKVLGNSRMHIPSRVLKRLTVALEQRAKPAEKVAVQILGAVARKKRLWIAPMFRPLWWFKRHFPGLYFWIARRLARRPMQELTRAAEE
jgi:short-subunit dehydrogenase